MPTSFCRLRRLRKNPAPFTNTDRRVQLAREVIKPPGDARQDLWIIQEIGKAHGGCRWKLRGAGRGSFTENGAADAVAEEYHLGTAGA